MNEAIRVREIGRIMEVTIDRPKVNAINIATSRELGRAFAHARDSSTVLVVILTGAGRVFSAGWDIKAGAVDGEGEDADFGEGGFAGLDIVSNMNKPVIAAVNGVAVGGGVEIVLACDLVVAADSATFSLPETSLGVMADAGGVQRLPRRLPRNIALEMLYTGRKMNAAEAKAWGLVNRIVPSEEVLGTAHEFANRIAAGAPLAVMAIKEVVRGIEGLSEEESLRAVRERRFATYATMLASEDRIEGPRAFTEKRAPVWRGK